MNVDEHGGPGFSPCDDEKTCTNKSSSHGTINWMSSGLLVIKSKRVMKRATSKAYFSCSELTDGFNSRAHRKVPTTSVLVAVCINNKAPANGALFPVFL
jgi:hypothetical protein